MSQIIAPTYSITEKPVFMTDRLESMPGRIHSNIVTGFATMGTLDPAPQCVHSITGKVADMTELLGSRLDTSWSVADGIQSIENQTFPSTDKPFSIMDKTLSMTDLTFSVVDSTLSSADGVWSAADLAWSVTDKTFSTTEKTRSAPDKTLSIADRVFS